MKSQKKNTLAGLDKLPARPIIYKNRPKNHAIFSCVDERAGAGLTYARPFPKYSTLRVVMRIYLLLPQIESDFTSTKVERLFALKTPGLSRPHHNLERQSDRATVCRVNRGCHDLSIAAGVSAN